MSTGETWTLGATFAGRPNALNFLRLCLAAQVLVWHSYSLRGDTWLPEALERFFADIAVDSFFAISGFLIARAWLTRPHAGRFLLARTRRILPGLWACLLVTAFVIAPAAAWWSGTAAPSSVGQWAFVLGNADVWVSVWGIDGGPYGVPHPGAWNGSLWSLGYEVGAYLVLLGLGLAGLLRRGVVAAVAVACWALAASLIGASGGNTAAPIWLVPRLGLMFSCGTLLWLYRDRVPVSRTLAWIAALVLVVSVATPNYRLVAAPAVAYLCIVGGLWLGRFPRLVLRNDLSYGVYVYGYPLQQALLLCGVSLGWAGFTGLSLVLVLPVAAVSWWLVERPFLRRRSANADRPIARLDRAPLHDPLPARQP